MDLPVPSPTQPFWQKELHPLSTHRSTENLPEKQDVLIIGAGFAGTAAAYYLTQESSRSPNTTILEAREACSGATGRNGGHMRPEALATFAKFSEKLGQKSAYEIWEFEKANADAVKNMVEDLHIDCDFERVSSCNVYLDEGLAEAAQDELARLTASGYDAFRKYKYHDKRSAEEISGISGAKGAVTFEAACLWPYKLVMHLLSIAVAKGVNLQTQTPVFAVSSSPDKDGYWTVSTSRGSTKARKILFAVNGYTRRLLPQYSQAIIPVRGICSHIRATSEERAMPRITKSVRTMGIKHSPGCQDYLISRPDGSIVVGGAWKVIRPGRREDWHNVTDDSLLVPAASSYYEGFMERTFKSWDNVKSKTDFLWTGIMGYTSDSLPHCGLVDNDKPGLFICAGFNGHGMPQVLLCAKGVAGLMLNSCDFAESGIPAAFRTGAERRR